MIFVGSGALLTRAVLHVRRLGFSVNCVCSEPNDASRYAIKRTGAQVIEMIDLNRDLKSLLLNGSGEIVFSINNRRIISDDVLHFGATFFNVHSGLIQHYRGIPEVCIVAALCRGERTYGVTLHRILPGQRVDSGPVVAQFQFDIGEVDRFSDVMPKSLDACQKIFEIHFESIALGDYRSTSMQVAQRAYSYRDLAEICSVVDDDSLRRASDLGKYRTVFPKLAATMESIRTRRDFGQQP